MSIRLNVLCNFGLLSIFREDHRESRASSSHAAFDVHRKYERVGIFLHSRRPKTYLCQRESYDRGPLSGFNRVFAKYLVRRRGVFATRRDWFFFLKTYTHMVYVRVREEYAPLITRPERSLLSPSVNRCGVYAAPRIISQHSTLVSQSS